MTAHKIKRRIIGKGRGYVFTPRDFLDLGSRAAVDQALSRLADQGAVRRLARGIYDYPKQSPRFGALSPDMDTIARAIARKDSYVVQVSPSSPRCEHAGSNKPGSGQGFLPHQRPLSNKADRAAVNRHAQCGGEKSCRCR